MVTRYGQTERQYVKPRDPKTQAQITIRSNLARVSARWRTLTEEQRRAWTLGAQDAHTRPRLGKSFRLTGCQLFIKINCARAALGLDQFDDPPKLPEFDPNPVGELSITNTRGAITLKLSVPARQPSTRVPSAAPCSAGKTSSGTSTSSVSCRGRTAAPARLPSFTWRGMGCRRPGMRVCIRTQQHINGWDDLPKQTSAIVPGA